MVFLGVSRVLNISDIPRISIYVVTDSLGTAVGEKYIIFSICSMAIPRFILAKIHSCVIIFHIITIAVAGRFRFVRRFFVGWSTVSWGSI